MTDGSINKLWLDQLLCDFVNEGFEADWPFYVVKHAIYLYPDQVPLPSFMSLSFLGLHRQLGGKACPSESRSHSV